MNYLWENIAFEDLIPASWYLCGPTVFLCVYFNIRITN